MNHRTNPRFWRCYNGLPKDIRDLADRNYSLLKTDPAHSSLHFKKIAVLWSVRVGLHYRALATESGADLVWFVGWNEQAVDIACYGAFGLNPSR